MKTGIFTKDTTFTASAAQVNNIPTGSTNFNYNGVFTPPQCKSC